MTVTLQDNIKRIVVEVQLVSLKARREAAYHWTNAELETCMLDRQIQALEELLQEIEKDKNLYIKRYSEALEDVK